MMRERRKRGPYCDECGQRHGTDGIAAVKTTIYLSAHDVAVLRDAATLGETLTATLKRLAGIAVQRNDWD